MTRHEATTSKRGDRTAGPPALSRGVTRPFRIEITAIGERTIPEYRNFSSVFSPDAADVSDVLGHDPPDGLGVALLERVEQGEVLAG